MGCTFGRGRALVGCLLSKEYRVSGGTTRHQTGACIAKHGGFLFRSATSKTATDTVMLDLVRATGTGGLGVCRCLCALLLCVPSCGGRPTNVGRLLP